MKNIKIIVERHEDGFVADPLGLKVVVVSQAENYDAAIADVKSAIRFHIDTFGDDVFEDDESPIIKAFIY